MNLEQWLLFILLGGLCGLLGQGVRAIIGLKKLKDANDDHKLALATLAAGEPPPAPPDPFSGTFLLISLFIGFIAGALAALGVAAAMSADDLAKTCQVNTPYCTIDPKTLITFVAAGYAGTDFIEGFMSKWLPK